MTNMWRTLFRYLKIMRRRNLSMMRRLKNSQQVTSQNKMNIIMINTFRKILKYTKR